MSNDVKMKRAGLLLFLFHPQTKELYFRCMIPSNPKYGGLSPQIPKGCIEPEHNERETAIKETQEEAGLYIHNLRWAVPFKDYIDMKLSIYIGTVESASDFGESDHETQWTGWVNYDQQRDKMRETQLHIFDEAAEYIKENFMKE